MKKDFEDNTEAINIDPITGNYYVIIPEWIANELSWYEDTEIKFAVEGDEIILTEKKDS